MRVDLTDFRVAAGTILQASTFRVSMATGGVHRLMGTTPPTETLPSEIPVYAASLAIATPVSPSAAFGIDVDLLVCLLELSRHAPIKGKPGERFFGGREMTG